MTVSNRHSSITRVTRGYGEDVGYTPSEMHRQLEEKTKVRDPLDAQ